MLPPRERPLALAIAASGRASTNYDEERHEWRHHDDVEPPRFRRRDQEPRRWRRSDLSFRPWSEQPPVDGEPDRERGEEPAEPQGVRSATEQP